MIPVHVEAERSTKSVMEHKLPKVIEEVGFDFRWDNAKVWKLDIPVTEILIDELIWHFDIPFWEKSDTDDYNLTPREVMFNANGTSEHRKKIENADTSYPIDIMENKGRWLILDGLHRLVKLHEQGKKIVKVRIIPKEEMPNILKDL